MASVYMLSSKSRSIFQKLINLDRLSVTSNKKYVTSSRKYTENSYTSERFVFDHVQVFPERKDWPTASIWKRFNFFDKDRFITQKRSYREHLDALTGYSYTPPHFYYLMTLRDHEEPWTETVATDFLLLLQTDKFGFTFQEQLNWVHYIKNKVEENGIVSNFVQELIMSCYLNLNYEFDPVDILNGLERSGRVPSQGILSKLMKRYVYLCDFPAARSIFEHIKEEMKPSPESLAVMITGLTMAGKRDQARPLEDALKLQTEGSKRAELQCALIMGYILGEDYKNAIKEGSNYLEQENSIYPILSMIRQCSCLKLDKGIDVLIDMIRKKGDDTFYKFTSSVLYSLMFNGFHEKAFELFLLLKDPPGHLFLKAAARSGMPPDLAFQYSKRMEKQGLRASSIDGYLVAIHYLKDRYDLQKESLMFYREKGLKLRPQDLWQQICHIRDDGTLNDLKEILPLYMLDDTTETKFLFPCLVRFGVNVEDIAPLFEENSQQNADEIKYLKYQFAWHVKDKKTAQEVLESGFDMKNVRLSLQDNIYFWRDLKFRFPENTKVEGFGKGTGGVFKDETLTVQLLKIKKMENANRQDVLQLATKLMKAKQFRDGKNLLMEAKLETYESNRGIPNECTFFNYTSNYELALKDLLDMARRQFLHTGSTNLDTRMWQIKFVNGIMRNFLDNIKERDDPNSYVQFLLIFIKEEDNLALAIYNMILELIQSSKTKVLNEVLSLPALSKNYADTTTISLALAFLEQGNIVKASAAIQKCIIPYMTYLRFINILAAQDKIDVLHSLYSIAVPHITDPEQIKDMFSTIQTYTAKSRGEQAGQDFYDKHSHDLKTLQHEGV